MTRIKWSVVPFKKSETVHRSLTESSLKKILNTTEDEKKARKLKLNVERCRAYRNRKKIPKVLSVTTIGTSFLTLEDFEGLSETTGNINQEGLCEDLKDLNITELIKLGQDISQVRPYEASTSDVQFYIVADLEGVPVLLTSDNTDLVSPDKDTKIIIHGWIENHRRSWYKTIADEYLKINDINFIEVDWENIARLPYISSAKNLKFVGDEIVKFIADMNLSAEKIHVIGHSLGAHVAGIVGKGILEKSGLKLARISGLDPAGPYFRDPLISSKDRLDKNDAEIVDAIHTDAGFYGYESPIGTLDIYVNRGRRVQPGCLSDLTPKSLGEMLTTSFCSHARSTVYFAEWINIGKFNCIFCDSIFNYNIITERCLFHQRTVSFSSDEVTKDVTGVCYATTNKEEPFLQ